MSVNYVLFTSHVVILVTASMMNLIHVYCKSKMCFQIQ